jgi:hypothetical protein
VPTLPQAADYGGRPGLQSNRMDQPEPANAATADALVNATNSFAQIAGNKKEKDDRLNYALRKNEIIQADIENRESLRNNPNYDDHDNLYSEGFNASRDEILGRPGLSSYDSAVLGSESDVIRERALVEVRNGVQVLRRDDQQSQIEAGLIQARETILSLDAESANDMMLSQLDLIQAAVDQENSIYTEKEGLVLSQKFVADVSQARLVAMDPEARIAALERSLTKRKTSGAITIEDIRAGKGTGSIADFVTRDTAQKMLDASKEEFETGAIMDSAYSIVDTAWDVYPEPDSWKERDAMIREATTGMENGALVRKEAEIIHRAATASATSDEESGKASEYQLWSAKIIDGTATYRDIPPESRAYMGAERVNNLLLLAEAMPEREGYGEFDDDVTYYKWRGMSNLEKANAKLMTADWMPLLTRETHVKLVDEQANIKSSIENGKPPASYKGDNDDEYLTNFLLGGKYGFSVRPTPGQPGYERWARVDKAYDDALKDESMNRIRSGQSGDLNADDRREILKLTLREQVFIRRDPIGPNFLRSDEALRTGAFVIELTPEQKKEAFVPINEVSKDIWDVVGGRTIMADEFLRNLAPKNKEPSDRDIEEAYFYLKYYGKEAALRRLSGDKDL